MIKYLEKTGKTDDEAIAAALEEIGMERDDVSVEIIERAKPGFLGIGAVPARVRVSWECVEDAALRDGRVHQVDSVSDNRHVNAAVEFYGLHPRRVLRLFRKRSP